MIDFRRARITVAAAMMLAALAGCSASTGMTGAAAAGGLRDFAVDFARQVLAAFLL